MKYVKQYSHAMHKTYIACIPDDWNLLADPVDKEVVLTKDEYEALEKEYVGKMALDECTCELYTTNEK